MAEDSIESVTDVELLREGVSDIDMVKEREILLSRVGTDLVDVSEC